MCLEVWLHAFVTSGLSGDGVCYHTNHLHCMSMELKNVLFGRKSQIIYIYIYIYILVYSKLRRSDAADSRARVYKLRVPSFPGEYFIFCCGTFLSRALAIELTSFYPSGVWNIQIAPRKLQNLCILFALYILGCWQCSAALKHWLLTNISVHCWMLLYQLEPFLIHVLTLCMRGCW